MNTNSIPSVYTGSNPYIFISYSHQDSQVVYEMMRHLQRCGCRIWYDSGIAPSRLWAETISSHIKNCALFLAFITDAYVGSDNCLNELDYARNHLGREQMFLIYRQVTSLPGEVELNFSRIQNLFAEDLDAAFYDRLLQAPGLIKCVQKIKQIGNLEDVTTIQIENLEMMMQAYNVIRTGLPLIVCTADLPHEVAQRCVDMLTGIAIAVNGRIIRIRREACLYLPFDYEYTQDPCAGLFE